MHIPRKWWSTLLGAAVAVSYALPTFGGGVIYKRDSAIFVQGRSVVEPRARIQIHFSASEYAFGSHQWGYVALAVVPETESMQPSAVALAGWDMYGMLTANPQQMPGLAEAASPFVFTFNAPERPGKYKVLLGAVPLFRDTPFKTGAGYKETFIPHTADRLQLARAIGDYPGSLQVISQFTVSASAIPKDESPPVYLRVNDKVPSEFKAPGGVQPSAITFSWTVGPEFKKDRESLLYRYRLEPEDDDWGAWTADQKVSYSFLLKGVHQFRVQARYSDAAGQLVSAPAMYQFTLLKDHVSKPTREALTKTPYGTVPPNSPTIAFSEVYAKSRALLVGMWTFDDASKFPQFDEKKITADITAMESALKANGFEVAVLKGQRVTRDQINDALGRLVDEAERNDRVFVYFSTHGFPDPVLPSEGYLATSDCQLARPTGKCLRLGDLQTHADRALDGKRVRQVLFAVDSCFSGLGIVRKSVGVPELTRLAMPQGAFMLTAGMASQLAQIDPSLGMSTFTHYLAEGLNGEADILGNNGLITLSELFVYVQYKVAEKTGANQIPMLGRMKGEGEMLFLPKRP